MLCFAVLLWRRGLFRWATAGFWAVGSLLLFLVVPVAVALLQGNISAYSGAIALSDGTGRVTWITLVCVAGIASFAFAYLSARPGRPTWNLPTGDAGRDPCVDLWPVMLGVLALGCYSLVRYRSRLVGNADTQYTYLSSFGGGQHTGGVSGYQYTAHMFLFVFVALALMSGSRHFRVLGWVTAFAYVVIGSLDPWARFLEVSMILVVATVGVVRRSGRWPRLPLILCALFLAVSLTLRGHTTFTSAQSFFGYAGRSPSSLPLVVSGASTDMLSSWYIWSYLDDRVTGYSYGIPLVNYALTGFLPSKLVPDKYFMIKWLYSHQRPVTSIAIIKRLDGQKSGLLGSFYSEGGILGVLILMAVAGYLSRKLDGMLSADSPILVRSLGIAWLSTLWMIWGSDDTWALNVLGTLAIPTIALWLFSRKRPRRLPGSRQLPVITVSRDLQGAHTIGSPAMVAGSNT